MFNNSYYSDMSIAQAYNPTPTYSESSIDSGFNGSPYFEEPNLLFDEAYNLTSDDALSTTTNEENYLEENNLYYNSNNYNFINSNEIILFPQYDPVTTGMHVPLTFNGDPKLLLVDTSRPGTQQQTAVPLLQPPPSPQSSVQEQNEVLVTSNIEDLPVFETQPTVSYEETYNILFGYSADSPLTVWDSEAEASEDEADKANKQSVKEDQYNTEEETEREEEETEREEEETEREEEETEKEEEETDENPASKRKRDEEDSSAGTATKRRRKKPISKKKPTVFPCPLCEHVSKRKYNLETHIKTHDKNRVKKFKCFQCQKGFDRRHDRNRHLATVHRLERNHECNHCSSKFSRGDALHRHLVQHHGYED